MNGYISHEIEIFSLKLFCSSQWQNLLRVNARREGYCQVSLRSWRYCLGARLKFRRRGAVIKKRSGDEAFEFLFLAAYAARDGFAAKSYLTTTEYRQLRRLLAGGTSKFEVFRKQ